MKRRQGRPDLLGAKSERTIDARRAVNRLPCATSAPEGLWRAVAWGAFAGEIGPLRRRVVQDGYRDLHLPLIAEVQFEIDHLGHLTSSLTLAGTYVTPPVNRRGPCASTRDINTLVDVSERREVLSGSVLAFWHGKPIEADRLRRHPAAVLPVCGSATWRRMNAGRRSSHDGQVPR
jgi:hypothetical protein